MKKSFSFLRSSVCMLAVCSVAAKILGVCYRIPLLNVLGAEGMGLYQLGFPLYAIVCALLGSGLTVSICRTVAILQAENKTEESEEITDTCLILAVILAILLAVVCVILARKVSAFMGNTNAALSLCGLLLSLPFVAASSCLKGYFQGRKELWICGVVQLVEQVGKLTIGLGLAFSFAGVGAQGLAACAAFGVTGAECCVFALFFLRYCRVRRHRLRFSWKRIRQIGASAFPLTLSSLSSPGFALVEGAIVVRTLTLAIGEEEATAQYGILTGAIIALLHAPSVVVSALSVSLLPTLSQASKGDQVSAVVGKYAKQVVFFGVTGSLAFAFFSPLCVQILYPSHLHADLIVTLLELGCPIVALSCCSVFLTSCLQGMGRMAASTVISLVSCLLKTVVLVLLLPIAGVYGAVAASVIGLSCCCLASAVLLLRQVEVRSFSFVSVPLSALAFGLAAATLRACWHTLIGQFLSAGLSLLVGIAVFVLICRFFVNQTRWKVDNQP